MKHILLAALAIAAISGSAFANSTTVVVSSGHEMGLEAGTQAGSALIGTSFAASQNSAFTAGGATAGLNSNWNGTNAYATDGRIGGTQGSTISGALGLSAADGFELRGVYGESFGLAVKNSH